MLFRSDMPDGSHPTVALARGPQPVAQGLVGHGLMLRVHGCAHHKPPPVHQILAEAFHELAAGRPAWIRIKVNSIIDEACIDTLCLRLHIANCAITMLQFFVVCRRERPSRSPTTGSRWLCFLPRAASGSPFFGGAGPSLRGPA